MTIRTINAVSELRAVELLSRAPLFKTLTADDKRVFASMKGLFRYARSETMFIEQGDADYCIYVIMSGKAQVHKDGVLVGEVAAGQFVGEVAFVTRELRSASVSAISDMVLLRIDAESFRRLPIRAREIVKDKMIEGLHHRIERMNAEIMNFRNELTRSDDKQSESSD